MLKFNLNSCKRWVKSEKIKVKEKKYVNKHKKKTFKRNIFLSALKDCESVINNLEIFHNSQEDNFHFETRSASVIKINGVFCFSWAQYLFIQNFA